MEAQDAHDREALLPKEVLHAEVPPHGALPASKPTGMDASPSSNAPAGKKPNVVNFRADNQSARRKEDDSAKSTGTMNLSKMLKNPRIRLYMATAVGSLPFLLSFGLYVSSFSFYGQFIIGFLCGLCVEGVYLLNSLHRTYARKHLVCDLLSHFSWRCSWLRFFCSRRIYSFSSISSYNLEIFPSLISTGRGFRV